MAFDVEGARKAGYSDDEILGFIRQSKPNAFDFDGAMKSGYSTKEIVDHIGGIKPGSSDGVLATIAKDLGSGVADVAAGYADSAEVAGKKDFAKFLKAGADLVRPDAKSYTAPEVKDPNKSWYDPSAYALSQVPRAIVRSAPGLATDIGAAAVGTATTGNPLGGLALAGTNYAARSAGSNIKERAANRTGDPNATPDNSDIAIGLGTTAAEAALNTLGVKGLNVGQIAKGGFKEATKESLKTTGKAALKEGGTEMGQEAVNQLGLRTGTDVEYDPGRAIEAGLVGAGAGGAFRLPKTAQDVIQSRRFEKLGIKVDDDSRYVADLLTKEGTDGSRQTAETLNKVEERLRADLSAALGQAVGKNSKATDSDKAFARGLAAAVRKGEALSEADITRISELGQTSKNLTRALNRYSVFDTVAGLGSRNRGNNDVRPYYAGGISDAIENLNPFRGKKATGYLAAALGGGAVIPGVTGLALPAQIASTISTVAPAAAAAGGVYAGARALDALTGYRNPADQFAQRFSSDPNQAPAGPTIREFGREVYKQPIGPSQPDIEGMARAAQSSQMAEWLKGGGKAEVETPNDTGTKFRATGSQANVYNAPIGPQMPDFEMMAKQAQAAQMAEWMKAGGKPKADDIRDVNTRFRSAPTGQQVYNQRPGPSPQSPAPMPMARPVYDEAVGPQLQTLAQMQAWLEQQQQGSKNEAAGVQGGMKALAKMLASLPKEEAPQAPKAKEVYKKPIGPEQPPLPNYFEAAQDGVKDAKTEATKVQRAMRDLNKILGRPEGVIDEAKAGTEAAGDEASAVQKAMKALKKELPKEDKPKEAPKKEKKEAPPKAEPKQEAKTDEKKPESKAPSISERLSNYKQMRMDDAYARMEGRDDIRDKPRYEKRMLDRIDADHSSIKDFTKEFSDKKLLQKLLDDIEPYSRVSKPSDGGEYLDRINKKLSDAVDKLNDTDFDAVSTLISRLDASKEKKK